MNIHIDNIIINQTSIIIDNHSYNKKDIKNIMILNIEEQFINSPTALEHIVLDAWAQTGIFTTPKFYICIKIEIADTMHLLRISKKAVSFGSKQYEVDKQNANQIIQSM